jgi:hypothetical protein
MNEDIMPPEDYHHDSIPIHSQEQPDSVVIFQLDPSDTLESIRRNLMGERWDQETQKWMKPLKSKPIMNKEGINVIMSEIAGRLDRNIFLSNLSDENIENICSPLHKNLTDLFILKYQEWDLDKHYVRVLVYRIMDIVHAALRRSKDKTTLNYLKGSKQIVEQFRHDSTGKKGIGLFGR